MKLKALLRAAMVMLAGGFVVTGCIDENYDLSNVDTTAQLQVKDLVLPINIDEIAMKEFIALEDTGHIQVVNGEYVLIDSGTYQSDEIIIPSLTIPAPTVPPIKSHITLIEENTPSSVKALPKFPMRFDIGRQMSAFTYKQSGITEYIVDMDMIGAEFDVAIDLVVEGLDNHVKSWTLEDFQMQFPKGLTGETNIGAYNPETGLYEGYQQGGDYIDGNTGDVMTFKNVIVLHARTSSDGYRMFADLVGTGNGYFACNGEKVAIKWSRKSAKQPFVYTLADGTPIELGVGTTYVGILPTTSSVTFE